MKQPNRNNMPKSLKNRINDSRFVPKKDAEAMLREIAFVLKMSRRILEEMTPDLAEEAVAAGTR